MHDKLLHVRDGVVRMFLQKIPLFNRVFPQDTRLLVDLFICREYSYEVTR